MFLPAETATTLSTSLEDARLQIEARFLDGGTVLLSVLDCVSKMIDTLDGMTVSAGQDEARRTQAELSDVMARLLDLPRTEQERQSRLADITVIEKALGNDVAAMRETLRYLRTFATTAKITGAGIAEFAGFAEEIIERIQFGREKAEAFASKLAELSQQLKPAIVRGKEIVSDYQQLVPGIAVDLAAGTKRLADHHGHLAAVAKQVRALAGNVQTKLATVLSAMQIGDITRQRIEHCQAALAIIDDYLAADSGRGLGRDRQERLRSTVALLVYLQLDETRSDFARDTTKIVKTMASFKSDIGSILELKQSMSRDEGAGTSLIRELETNVASAQAVVEQVTAATAEADQLSESTGRLVQELVDGIEIVKVVRTDIQYMALNTNLRCSRIGEEGRAINVVTAELRTFAAQMDETAEHILGRLQVLQTHAAALAGAPADDGDTGLHTRLGTALTDIQRSAVLMETSLDTLDRQGELAVEQMDSTARKLDFQAHLGDVLEACAAEIAGEAPEHLPDTNGIEEALADIGQRIGRLYTMVSERELHARIFGSTPTLTTTASSAPASDDELFEDALF